MSSARTRSFPLSAAVLLLFAVAGGADQPDVAVPVRFELSPHGNLKALEGKLVLRPAAADGEPVILPVHGGAPVAVQLPTGSVWEVVLDAPGAWAPSERLRVEPSEVPITRKVPVWPRGTVAGGLALAGRAERLPPEVTLTTVEPPEVVGLRRAEAPRARQTCPVSPEGFWRCELPAAKLNLAVSAAGFVPYYRWGIEIPVGKPLDLGSLSLQRGASVAGWLEAEEGALVPGRCNVRLSPLLAPGDDSQVAALLEEAAVETSVGRDGFFQIAGVAPGNYLLEARQPGFAPARVFPVEVLAGKETVLRPPLVLKRPLALELAIVPALDWRGRPWSVRIARTAEGSGAFEKVPAFDGEASAEGRVAVADLSPGRYVVEVLDSVHNSFFYDSAFMVETPEEARRTLTIDLVSIAGKLSLGKEPLAATIWFGGRHGAQSVALAADGEGRFEGVLPRAGRWRVEVAAQDRQVKAQAWVEVKPDTHGRAKADVRLPGTRLFGRVLDDNGRPVARAAVYLDNARTHVETRSDGEGAYELRGFEVGTASVRAEAFSPEGRRVSEAAALSAAEDFPVGPIDLHLQRMRPLAGRVLSPLGPVAGAALRVTVQSPGLFFGTSGRTGLEGEFSVGIPAAAEAAEVIVSPPGYALTAFNVAAGGSPAVLNVAADGGDLEIESPYTREELEAGLGILIFQGGTLLPIGDLAAWTLGHGKAFSNPERTSIHAADLAPGHYSACLFRRDARPPAPGGGLPPGASCAAGTLAPGATLRLRPSRLDAAR